MAKARLTAVAAQKGGTGKTALAASLGPLWACAGERVLLPAPVEVDVLLEPEPGMGKLGPCEGYTVPL